MELESIPILYARGKFLRPRRKRRTRPKPSPVIPSNATELGSGTAVIRKSSGGRGPVRTLERFLRFLTQKLAQEIAKD